MLIWFVDMDPAVAARMSNDNFVDKLIAEGRQIFTGALSHFFPRAGKRVAYANHPFTLWVAQSEWAWNWLVEYCRACAVVEKPKRFPKTMALHKAWVWIRDELEQPPYFRYHTRDETPPMPLPEAALFGLDQRDIRDHEQVVAHMRLHHLVNKWDLESDAPRWQYLYASKAASPPAYLPVSSAQKRRMQELRAAREPKRTKKLEAVLKE